MSDFGKEMKYPSTTQGMIALMQAFEAAHEGVEMPIDVGGSREFLYIQDQMIASVVSSHGAEIEF